MLETVSLLRSLGKSGWGVCASGKHRLGWSPGLDVAELQTHLGEELLQIPHKDASLLLNELLAAVLQVPVHVFLRVDVVLLYFGGALR